MRVVVLFFLLLCSYLLGGHPYAHAGRQASREGYSLKQPVNPLLLQAAASHLQQVAPGSGSRISEEHSFLVNIDDEDEDFARKLIVLAPFITAFSYAFILICLCNSLKEQLPFCRHFSYTSSSKYLVQRVLRI